MHRMKYYIIGNTDKKSVRNSLLCKVMQRVCGHPVVRDNSRRMARVAMYFDKSSTLNSTSLRLMFYAYYFGTQVLI